MLAFYRLIQSFHNPLFDLFFILLSYLGSEPIYILIIAVLFWNVDKRFGFRLTVLFLTSMAFNGFLKDFFHTRRPIGQPGIRSIYLSSAAGNSFPSGHTQGAATFYPYLWQHWPKQKRWLITGIFLITGVGFSRLYLGVHWPGDVIGGFIIGILIVWGFKQTDKVLLKLPFSLGTKILLALTLPLLALLVYHSKQGWQLIGFAMGFTAGYFLEDYFLDYRERTGLALSVYKTLLGLSLLGLWILLWHSLARHYIWLYLPVFAAGGIWTSFLAPGLFRRLGWEGPLSEEGTAAFRAAGGTDQT